MRRGKTRTLGLTYLPPRKQAPMPLRPYRAVVWQQGPDTVGVRITVMAEDLEDAERKLKQQYGESVVYTLYNEEDADKAR